MLKVEPGRPVTLDDLDAAHRCHWIVAGEGEGLQTLCCGEVRDAGAPWPYCLLHAAIALAPPRPPPDRSAPRQRHRPSQRFCGRMGVW